MAGEKTRHFKWVDDGKATLTEENSKSVFTHSTLPPAIVTRLATYGLKKLLSDRTAAEPDTKTKLAMMQELMTALAAGTWSEGRESAPKSTLFTAAVARVAKMDEAAVIAKLEAQPDEARKAYIKDKSKHPAIAAAMAEISLERAQAAAKQAKQAAKGVEAAFTL
jgi:hypothetical protein